MTRVIWYLGLVWLRWMDSPVKRRAFLAAVIALVIGIAFGARRAEAFPICCNDYPDWICRTFGIC